MSWSQIARRIRVPAGFVGAALYLWLARPRWYSLAGGALFVAAGLAWRAVASGQLRKNEALATTGPYAVMRHPLYAGSGIMAAGFVLAALSWWVVIMLVGFLFIYAPVIRAEEQFLSGKFPEYEAYARRVPAIAVPWRGWQGKGSAFSRELYLQHREYNAIVGALLIMAALVVKLVWWK
jgi:protein-S-isoprenylcysteine O-methyltransferase Ste14